MGGETSRERLIEAGVDALLELTPTDILSAAGAKAIAARAGVGVTTLYHHFGSLDGFAEAIVARIFSFRTYPLETITDGLESITGAPFPSSSTIDFHVREFERITKEREFRARIGLWALGGRQTDVAFDRFLRDHDAQIADRVSVLLQEWGLEVQPPFDLAWFAAVHTAFANGGNTRFRVSPDLMEAHRYARVGAALTWIMLRPIGDTRTVDDRLAMMNQVPLRAARGDGRRDPGSATRTRILEAAAVVFASLDYASATIPTIAAQAGLSTSTVYAHCSSVADLAVGLLTVQADAALAERGTPPADLRERLTWVATFLAERLGIAEPYAHRVLADVLEEDDPLLGELAGALEAAVVAGTLRADLDATRTARLLATTLLAVLLAEPAAGAGRAVAEVEALLLPGLAARTPA